jgi:long-chain acyl-CoA synthetase
MHKVNTVGEVIQLIKTYSNPKALVTYKDTGWQATSSQEFVEAVKKTALGLVELGIQPGDRVGIYALPSSQWTIADIAIIAIGAVSVPLFANISEDNFLFQITQSGLKTLFVGNADQWRLCEEHMEFFQHCIGFENTPSLPQAIPYAEFLQSGDDYEKEHPHLFEKLLSELKSDTLATIIYTSGTTGEPKGAEHTHGSITQLLHVGIFNWDPKKDVYLNILPTAHVFARMINFIMVAWGIPVYYFNDIKNLGFACQQVRPTFMIVVPRLLEKMYSKMLSQVQNASPVKRLIGLGAFRLAHLPSTALVKRWLHPLADHLVYKKLREALGGNLRIVISGGAPLNPSLYHFFIEAGFPIYEGWGLTETCPVSVNRIGHIKIGTVGPAIPGMQVITSPEGELLVQGEMMMRSYYKNPKETKLAFDENKWLRTGDKGTIDKEGFITILGRLKELLKTSTGEAIAPIPIEQALCQSPYVDMAMVVAENRKFVSCLLFPDFDALKTLKKKKGLTHVNDEEFLKSQVMFTEVEKLLNEVNRHLNRASKIRDFRFIHEPLTIDAGDLTPSMKIRRDHVERKYKDLIDSMYNESRGVG